jgi:hypothetical protein
MKTTEKRSCVFSEHVREGAARTATALLIAVALFGASTDVRAAEALDQSYLLLPAYDVVSAADQKAKVIIGDKLKLKLQGLAATDAAQVEPSPGKTPFTEQGWDIEAAQQQPGGEFTFLAIPMKPGKLVLEPMSVKDSKGGNIARTNPFEIEVVSAIAPNDPSPDTPVAPVNPVSLKFPIWILIVGGLLLLALACGVYFLVRKFLRRNKKPQEALKPKEPPKPEDQLALEELERLDRQGLLSKGLFKPYCFGISEILKKYFGSRYRFDAAESTSGELVSWFDAHKVVSEKMIDRVELLFEKLDRVKFTDYIPERDSSAALLADARQIILETRKPVEPVLTPGPTVSTEKTNAV